MSHTEILSAVRLQAVQAFAHFRLTDGPEPRESILLSRGIYCGRRFEAERGYGVWQAEIDELRVFRLDGKLLTTIPAASQNRVAARAAA